MTDSPSEAQVPVATEAWSADKPCCDAAVKAALERLQLEHAETQTWRLEARERFGRIAFHLLWMTLVAILALVLLDGFGVEGFKVDPSVLIALVTGVAANVFALVVLVMKFVYASPAGGWLGSGK